MLTLFKSKIKNKEKNIYANIFKNYKTLILALLFGSAILLPEHLAIPKFILIMFGLIFASNTLGFATEELSAYFSSTLSGFLNATLGNLAELIIGFFVIKQGHAYLAQASITGSILSNLVLLVGLAYLVAAYKKDSLKISNRQADTSSTMLLTSVLFLLFPSLLYLFHEEAYVVPISLSVAIIMLAIYIFYLIFSFFTHKHWFTDEKNKHTPVLSKNASILLMVVSILILTVLSEHVAGMLEAVGHALHLNDLFLGAIVVGFVGNAAEHLSVVTLAAKGKHEFVLPIAVGSSLQVAMFVSPILVLLSYFTGNIMTLAFAPLEIFSLFVAILLANQIASDNEITWFESIQLIGLYIIISIVFFFAH